MADNKMPGHPTQPTVQDDRGVLRFRQNAIVRFLLDAGPFNLEKLATMPFSDEDRAQFSQLIGYSVGGYSDLFYVEEHPIGHSPMAADRYRAAMDRTRHTTLRADEILVVLDLYLDRARDDFAAFVALQGFRGAITGGADLAALLAYFEKDAPDGR